MSIHYLLKQGLFKRWIIVDALDEQFAWSGSFWVPIGGDTQICNFDSPEEATAYAEAIGLEPAFETVDYNAPPEDCA